MSRNATKSRYPTKAKSWPADSVAVKLVPGLRVYYEEDGDWRAAVVVEATHFAVSLCPLNQGDIPDRLGRVELPDGRNVIATSPCRIRAVLEGESHECWMV